MGGREGGHLPGWPALVPRGFPEASPPPRGLLGSSQSRFLPVPAESDSLGLRTQAVLWFGLGPTAP